MTSPESLQPRRALAVRSSLRLRSPYARSCGACSLLAALLLLAALPAAAAPGYTKHKSKAKTADDDSTVSSPADKPKAVNAYDFGLPSEDGKNLPLDAYKGKVLLIVNLGRDSSYASQLAGLEKLSETYKDKGLVVIGVPSNDFGDAEPGSDADVAKAYSDAKVPFLVTQRSTLTGVHELPLFDYLAKNKAIPNDGLHWNYTKFIVDRKGNVILRFAPEVSPDSLDLQAPLLEVLDGTWKPAKPKGDHTEEASNNDDDDD